MINILSELVGFWEARKDVCLQYAICKVCTVTENDLNYSEQRTREHLIYVEFVTPPGNN